MRLSREFNFTISAFHHALEAYMIPDLVKESGATVATFRCAALCSAACGACASLPHRKRRWCAGCCVCSDLWGYKMEAYDASTRSPSILNDASVPVALKSDHPVLFSKDMMLEAAKAHYYGLPRCVPRLASMLACTAPADVGLPRLFTVLVQLHGDCSHHQPAGHSDGHG